jgi:hypothetical protein
VSGTHQTVRALGFLLFVVFRFRAGGFYLVFGIAGMCADKMFETATFATVQACTCNGVFQNLTSLSWPLGSVG